MPDRLALTVYAGRGMFWILYLILAAGLQGANTAEYCANSKKQEQTVSIISNFWRIIARCCHWGEKRR
jgi:hypothetical protein